MAERLRFAAERWSAGRVIAVLEGGYDLDGLAGGMTSVLRALTSPLGAPPAIAPLPDPGKLVRAAIDGTLAAHAAAGTPIPAAETGR